MGAFGAFLFLGVVVLYVCWYFWREELSTTWLNQGMRETARNSDAEGDSDGSMFSNDSFLNSSAAQCDESSLPGGFPTDVHGMPMMDYSTQIQDMSSDKF